MVNFSIGQPRIPGTYSTSVNRRRHCGAAVEPVESEDDLRFRAKSTGEATISLRVIMHGTSAERRIDTSNRQG